MKYPKVLFAALGIAVLAATPTLIGRFKRVSAVSHTLRDALFDFKLPTKEEIFNKKSADQQTSGVAPKNVSDTVKDEGSSEQLFFGGYNQEYSWQKPDGMEKTIVLSEVELLGIQKQAEKVAIEYCRSIGVKNCVPTSSTPAECSYYRCASKASAHTLNMQIPFEVFSAQVQGDIPEEAVKHANPNMNGVQLAKLGILKKAENEALEKCRHAGYLTCVVVDFDCKADSGSICDYSAKVRGYK